jgi:hypothetical protein
MARVVPHLTRGVSQVARTLFRSPATRPLLRAVPHIAKRTIANVARLAASGRPITPRTAVRLLARQTARALSSPRQAAIAFRRSRALDRRYHRAARPLIGRRTVGPTPPIPWRPIYSRPAYASQPVIGTYTPAGAAAAPVAIAPCQCFQPVNCATCGR